LIEAAPFDDARHGLSPQAGVIILNGNLVAQNSAPPQLLDVTRARFDIEASVRNIDQHRGPKPLANP
jgi:hypothetical protein